MQTKSRHSVRAGASLPAFISFALSVAIAAPGCNNRMEAQTNDLPHCGSSPIVTAVPSDFSAVDSILQYGSVWPSKGDVFGQDILFFELKTQDKVPVSVPVQATAEGWVTTINRFEILDSDTDHCTDDHVVLVHDYDLYLQSCQEAMSVVIAARTISPALASRPFESCRCYSAGNITWRACSVFSQVAVHAGEQIATAGGANGKYAYPSIGLRGFDVRIPVSEFANPSRLEWRDPKGFDDTHLACPLDFVSGPAATSGGYKQLASGLQHAPGTSACGVYNQDVVGSARGFWYVRGLPTSPSAPHLALLDVHGDPSRPAFSMGTSVPGMRADLYGFAPGSETMNTPFADVHPGSGVHCYQSLIDSTGTMMGGVLLLQMPDAQRLWIEKQEASSCGGAPGFDSSKTEFVR